MRYFSCLMMVGLLPAWAPIGLAPAQETEAEKVMKIILENQTNLQTRLFSLNQVDMRDFVNTVRAVYNVPNVSSVERTNSVVVRSTSATLDEIAGLLEQMKQQKPKDAARELIQVVPLTHRDPGMITELLDQLFHDTHIMPDHDSGQIILKSDNAAEIAEILRMIKALDASATGPPQGQVRTLAVTIDFIQASVGTEGEGSLPDNLQEVGAALRKSGLGKLSLYGHLMVRTQEGQEFKSNGVVRSGQEGTPVSLVSARGTAKLVNGRAELQIRSILRVPIAQTRADKTGKPYTTYTYEEFGLTTTTTVPLGDYLVLGAMPTATGDANTILMVIHITAE